MVLSGLDLKNKQITLQKTEKFTKKKIFFNNQQQKVIDTDVNLFTIDNIIKIISNKLIFNQEYIYIYKLKFKYFQCYS